VAEKRTADIYDLEGKTKMFTLEAERTEEGGVSHYTATYKDTQGNVVGTEKGESAGGKLVKYEPSRVLTEDSGLVEVKDGKIYFTYIEKGKKSTSRDNFKENTLYSGMLVPFIQDHLDKIVAGDSPSFPYVAWFRKETVGFQVSYDKDKSAEGQIAIKMNPTNLLYRSLVNPIYFNFDKATKKLVSIKGRTFLKAKIDGRIKDFDGIAKYN
jgi:hypothetical protein